jgi:hypothetical protein
MLPRLLILSAVLLVAGCGGSATTTAPAPKADGKLPPEVEFDPATAADMHKKAKKSKP